MQPIAEWLANIGLERYAPAFAENDIDFSVLPHLTDADLERIGVSLGHRRKILAAIAGLVGGAQSAPQPVRSEPKPQETAKRRQVTVMFSDLVGSTTLSARMDPEDLREVISSYQKCVAETVSHFGGFVAKYMGDGVLVYFGYPQAHEDDAERTVRAGLALIAAVGALKAASPLQTRVFFRGEFSTARALLVFHRALPDLQRMKLCYSAAASSAPRSVFSWCD